MVIYGTQRLLIIVVTVLNNFLIVVELTEGNHILVY